MNFKYGINIENYVNNLNLNFFIIPPLVSIYSIDPDDHVDHGDHHDHQYSPPKSPGGVHHIRPTNEIIDFQIF